MIVVNVRYFTKPGMRDAFYEAVMKSGVPEKSRAEEGNLKYDYYFSVDDPDEVFLLENWKDSEAFEFHKTQDHFLNGLTAIKEEFLQKTELKIFEG